MKKRINILPDQRASPLVEEALLIVIGLMCIVLLLGVIFGLLEAFENWLNSIVEWPFKIFEDLFPFLP
ncbi:MAG: hypothetical protein ACFFC7_11005 [Candidatus Hermodarchaeota archaeon]